MPLASRSRRRTAWTGVITLVLTLLVGSSAFGDHSNEHSAGPPTTTHNIQPVFLPGNNNCPAGANELRVNNPGSDTYSIGGFSVTVDLYNTPDGFAFDFQTSGGAIDDMFVKGGPDTNFYDWPSPVTSDTFLHAPVNPNNGKFYGLSHVSFCFVEIATIQVTKFIDANEDGIANDGTPAHLNDLAGWTFEVKDSGGNVVCTLTTDTSGTDSCEVAPGDYTVTETNVGDPLSSNGATTIITTDNDQLVGVVSGDTGTATFGNTCVITKHFAVTNVPAGTTGLKAIYDTSIDGNTTGGTEVALTDAGNGVLDDGIYGGTATETFSVNDSLEWSYAVAGSEKFVGSESFATSGYPSCERTNTVEFAPPTIEVFKLKDADDDGDTTDPDDGLEGWTIQLYNADGTTLLDSKVTDATGRVAFEDLAPGTYQVAEVLLDNWIQTYPANRHTVTVGIDETETVEFLNSPESEIRVGFTDLTGYTNVHIECIDANGVTVMEYDSTGNVDVEDPGAEVVNLDDIIRISQSEVTCTFEIVDP